MSPAFKTTQAKAIYDGCLMALDDIWEGIIADTDAKFRASQCESETVVEVIKSDGRDLNQRLINTRRMAASAKRRMRREVKRRFASTRSSNLLQQTNESLVVKSRTSKLECDNIKGMYNELRDTFESRNSEYTSLKRRFDDSQAEYDSLRSAHDSLREEHYSSQLRFRELEEAHENSKLEYQKREEELQGSIAELKEALDLTNAGVEAVDLRAVRLRLHLRYEGIPSESPPDDAEGTIR